MIVTYSNYATAGNCTVAASSTAAGSSASNLLHPQKEKVWLSSSASDETLTFSFGSAVTISAYSLINSNGQSTNFNVRLYGNTSDSWGSPAYSDPEADVGPGNSFYQISTPNSSYQFWRVKFIRQVGTPQLQIGCIMLGQYLTLPTPSYSGYQDAIVDPSRHVKSAGGQTYSEILPTYKTFRVDWQFLTTTQKNTFQTFVNDVGTSKPFLCQVMPSTELNEWIYVRLTKPPQFEAVGYDTSIRWNTSLEFEELL